MRQFIQKRKKVILLGILVLFIGITLSQLLFTHKAQAICDDLTPLECLIGENGFSNADRNVLGRESYEDAGGNEGLVASGFKVVLSWFAYILFWITSWLLSVAGLLFDFVLTYTIVNMKVNLSKITAIDSGWVLFRDLGNMMFIFILVYIAIKTILGMDSGQTKRILVNVIIIGLLVNFSLFFTKFLIDISNILATSFYNKIVLYNGQTSISWAFTSSLGLGDTINPMEFANNINTSGSTWGAILMFGLGGSIFIIITAFAFFYASALFIIRYISLIFLIVLSPLPFFAYILPSTRKYAQKWWDALVGQLIFAPLYILILYVALVFTTSSNIAITGNNTKDSLSSVLVMDPVATRNNPNTGMAMTFNFVLTIGFILAGSMIATKVAAGSGGIIGKAVNAVDKKIGTRKMTAVVGTTTLGAAGAASRNTLGRAASWAAREDTKLGAALRKGSLAVPKTKLGVPGAFLQRAISRNVLGGLQGTAKSSFDMRNSEAFKEAGLNLGKSGGVGGYDAKLEKQVKDTIKYAEDHGGMTPELRENLKVASQNLLEANNEYARATQDPSVSEDERARLNKAAREAQKKVTAAEKQAESQRKNQQLAYMTYLGTSSSPSTAFTKVARKYKEASRKFIKGEKPASESEELKKKTQQFADVLRGVISDPTTGRVADRPRVAEILADMTPNQIKELDGYILAKPEVYEQLSIADLTGIQGVNKLTRGQRDAIGTYIRRHQDPLGTDEQKKLYEYLQDKGKGYW